MKTTLFCAWIFESGSNYSCPWIGECVILSNPLFEQTKSPRAEGRKGEGWMTGEGFYISKKIKKKGTPCKKHLDLCVEKKSLKSPSPLWRHQARENRLLCAFWKLANDQKFFRASVLFFFFFFTTCRSDMRWNHLTDRQPFMQIYGGGVGRGGERN